MKIKDLWVPFILFLIGVSFYLVGILFKTTHWEMGIINGDVLFIIASVFQFIAIIMAIIKLLKSRMG